MTEHNTYVFDTESAVEMARLIDQDRVTTKAMGGPLSGVPVLQAGTEIIDLACGPGGWVLDVAYERPDIEVAGVDISKTMIDYANARAWTQGLTNASFGIMDITKPLDFPDANFDLVNARFLTGVLKRVAWPTFLAECTRILKPGGILRLTEPIDFGETNSAAQGRTARLAYEAFHKAGYGFSADGHNLGMSNTLPGMLRSIGYQQVRCLQHAHEYSADCEAWQDGYENMKAGQVGAALLYVKTGVASAEEVEQLYQQVFLDMHSPDFRSMWHLITVLGTKP